MEIVELPADQGEDSRITIFRSKSFVKLRFGQVHEFCECQ